MTETATAATRTCPQCDGTMKAARVPTDAEYRKAFDRENPGTLPTGSDTASPEQRAELGALYRCSDCGLNQRVKADDAPAPASAPAGAFDSTQTRR